MGDVRAYAIADLGTVETTRSEGRDPVLTHDLARLDGGPWKPIADLRRDVREAIEEAEYQRAVEGNLGPYDSPRRMPVVIPAEPRWSWLGTGPDPVDTY